MILALTTDKFDLVTSAAVAVDVHVSYIDASNTTLAPSGGGKQNTAITTATTTDVLAAPGASTLRTVTNAVIRNKGAAAVTVTWRFNQNGTAYEIMSMSLLGGEQMVFTQATGWFKVSQAVSKRNFSTASQGPGFATDTYVSNSFLVFPSTPVAGMRYRLRIGLSKTNVGTAAPVVTVRVGTAGTTADTARITFTFGAGTAAADTADLDIECYFRSVGSGTSAVLVGVAAAACLPSSGWSSTIKGLSVVSGGFDSTVASLGIGVSYNGGTSASHTINSVSADILPS